MNNKQAGNEFEREFCEMLSKDGFWSNFMGGNRNGQPADIIEVRNEKSYLIDAKDCKNDRFELIVKEFCIPMEREFICDELCDWDIIQDGGSWCYRNC